MSGLRAPRSGFAVGLMLSAVLAGCSSMPPTPPPTPTPVVEVCAPVADTYAGDGDPAGYPCGGPR